MSSRPGEPVDLQVITERDVGLFSLLQQVIAQVPWALRMHRIPVVLFRGNTSYWTPGGYRGNDTVWEYYFEPLVAGYPASTVSERVREMVASRPPYLEGEGYFADEHTFVSAHYGDHPHLLGMTLPIPYLWDDPDARIRAAANEIMRRYVRPREYISEAVETWAREHMDGCYVIGVHSRGTDAISEEEVRPHRQNSLKLSAYVTEIERLIAIHPSAKVFVATDDQSSLDYLRRVFGARVLDYGSIRHKGGVSVLNGPTGWAIMPAYVARDRDVAARNGEEATIEYLLLSLCDHLVHNGSGLARTVLLNAPHLAHTNTNPPPPDAEPATTFWSFLDAHLASVSELWHPDGTDRSVATSYQPRAETG